MPPPGSRAARPLFPRSLVASASVHALLIATGIAWSVVTRGGDRPAPRVYALRFDEPRPEPRTDEEVEPIVEEPRTDEHEPELRETERWDEPVAMPEETREPAPPLRAVDWLDRRPLEIASLPTRPEPEPAPLPPEIPREPPPETASASAVAQPGPPSDVIEPDPLENAPPVYPRLARRAGEEGSVLCRLHLSADGSVARVEVVESSGFARLDDAAREALAHWRYRPRLEEGRAVATSLLHRVTFRLES